jgi:hypothetical protein
LGRNWGGTEKIASLGPFREVSRIHRKGKTVTTLIETRTAYQKMTLGDHRRRRRTYGRAVAPSSTVLIRLLPGRARGAGR